MIGTHWPAGWKAVCRAAGRCCPTCEAFGCVRGATRLDVTSGSAHEQPCRARYSRGRVHLSKRTLWPRSALPGRAISCRTEIASVLRTSFQAVVGTLSLPVAPSIRFPLPQKFGSRSQRSSAFAAGQVKRQVTPEGA